MDGEDGRSNERHFSIFAFKWCDRLLKVIGGGNEVHGLAIKRTQRADAVLHDI